jgi:hypothetical protein
MKKQLLTVILLALTTGCARYGTTQEDISYHENGKPSRKIITKVNTGTFWAAKSELAKSAVTQTDKSQSSKVGAVNQFATNSVISDMTQLIEAVNRLKKP